MTHSEKNKSTETIPEKDQIANLPDKDFKKTVLKIHKELEDVGKVKKTSYEQNGNINKDIKNIKRNQKEILELKIIITKIKISLNGFKIRFEQSDISGELEDN